MCELNNFNDSDIEIAIVGNKCDLENNRQVSDEAVGKYAKKVGAEHYLTSAKAGKGVQEVFNALAKSNILYIFLFIFL